MKVLGKSNQRLPGIWGGAEGGLFAQKRAPRNSCGIMRFSLSAYVVGRLGRLSGDHEFTVQIAGFNSLGLLAGEGSQAVGV